MAQDYAKRKKAQGKRKAGTGKSAARRNTTDSPPRGRGLRLYLGGVLTGVFISFIAWLTTLPDPDAPREEDKGTEQAAVEAPKPRWDFYELLPEQTIEVEVEEVLEPAADVSKPIEAGSPEKYILQAGSFRQEEDAKRRRAQLILLGLGPSIREAEDERGRLFRVYLGPFDSLDSVSRARGLTAGEGIETLVLKRGEP